MRRGKFGHRDTGGMPREKESEIGVLLLKPRNACSQKLEEARKDPPLKALEGTRWGKNFDSEFLASGIVRE